MCSRSALVTSCRAVALESRINSPAFGGGEDAGEWGRLAQGGRSFAVFLQQRENFRQGPPEDLPPCIPVRLGTARRCAPSRKIAVGDPEQRGLRPELVCDRPMQFQAAAVDPLVSCKGKAHPPDCNALRGRVYRSRPQVAPVDRCAIEGGRARAVRLYSEVREIAAQENTGLSLTFGHRAFYGSVS